MKSAKVSIGDSVLASQLNNLIDDAKGGSFLLPHQQATPDLTLKIEAGVCYVGATRVVYAGGNTPAFTAPTGGDKRIDLVTIDAAGTIAITQGTPGGAPTAPAYPTDKLVICEVYIRTGSTSVKDTDDSAAGYIYNDVRPFLGGAYIASAAQIANGIIPSSKFAAADSDIIPDGNNTRSLGTSTAQWATIRAIQFYQNGFALASGKFGGTGADGALAISSGTTTLDVGAAKVFVKNYTTIDITGTGKLAFSNPHAGGTIIILKATGAVTITSSTNPAIDIRAMGGALGPKGTSGPNDGTAGGAFGKWLFNTLTAAGFGKQRQTTTGGGGGGGASASNNGTNGGNGAGTATGGTGGVSPLFGDLAGYLIKALVCPGGGGGGGGGGNSGNGGDGGAGGGALYMEVGGALNITSTINAAGANGGAASGTGEGGGYGGGGGGGCIVILYASLTANSGTYTVNGGTGGSGSSDGGNGGSGGAGYSLVAANTEFV